MSDLAGWSDMILTRPSKEEWEARQRNQIRQRWEQIAFDLTNLAEGGLLDKSMTLEQIVHKLRSTTPEIGS